MGPVIVMGDFNAHIGVDSDPRSTCTTNAWGVLLNEVVDRCGLHIASLGMWILTHVL